MSRPASPSSWAGAVQILRFNWPDYALALGVCVSCVVLLASPSAGIWHAVGAAILAPTAYLLAASLFASHWIYDRSALADWAWLPAWLPARPGRWMLIQAGFDSTYGQVASLLPPSPLPVLDLYGTLGVNGASVRRARQHAVRRGELPPTVDALPSDPAAADVLLAIFALHEIRARRTREEFFHAMNRTLSPGGCLLLVEHVRDWKNFLVFGPGFAHFLPEREWRHCAGAARLRLERTASITPFVRVFLWRRP